MDDGYVNFYENVDRNNTYSTKSRPEDHGAFRTLSEFVYEYELKHKKVLEVGSSKGIFQDLVEDYTGLDIAESLRPHYHKPFFTINNDGSYPFGDAVFDAAWSWAVFEHIPDIDQALNELVRVVRPGGLILFAPAWQCRSWAADGYPVRPYSDFNIKGKLIKFSIPLRNSVLWRSMFVVPIRILRHLSFLLGNQYKELPYKKLMPNYEKFWMSDSDAVNSIDPHAAILWFKSHGCECLSHPSHLSSLSVRGRALVFQKT